LVSDLARRGRHRSRPGVSVRRDRFAAYFEGSGGAGSAKLFWRYKYNDQQAARDGDWKYLKILDNTFLFDVAQDPMERANLKERHRDVYERLVAEWNEWNATMLPLDPQSFTGGFSGAELADHFGIR
jgi:arylsulfatase A-like enzyme